jgi:20S proteasome alpha/beta subunit
MSFVITLYVREGIVMASDSRLTLNSETVAGAVRTRSLAVALSDANYKTFLAPNRIGISTYGAADIGGVPIGGYIESFLVDKIADSPATPETVARGLLAHFQRFDPPPATQFHVGGYAEQNGTSAQQVWHVDVGGRRVEQMNPPGQQGATWGGEGDILARLVQPVGQLDSSGKLTGPLPHFPIPFQFFTLQDAIDFAVFALRATIDAIRFQPRAKTVGGPIDVLVIKPTEATWIQRKALQGERRA